VAVEWSCWIGFLGRDLEEEYGVSIFVM